MINLSAFGLITITERELRKYVNNINDINILIPLAFLHPSSCLTVNNSPIQLKISHEDHLIIDNYRTVYNGPKN